LENARSALQGDFSIACTFSLRSRRHDFGSKIPAIYDKAVAGSQKNPDV
jgi:hypothetical protein